MSPSPLLLLFHSRVVDISRKDGSQTSKIINYRKLPCSLGNPDIQLVVQSGIEGGKVKPIWSTIGVQLEYNGNVPLLMLRGVGPMTPRIYRECGGYL